jgi:hypothetical protein
MSGCSEEGRQSEKCLKRNGCDFGKGRLFRFHNDSAAYLKERRFYRIEYSDEPRRRSSYKQWCSGRRLFTPTQLIRTHKLYHRQVYEFAYHRAKLAFLKDGTLDDKRASGANSTSRFSALANFLESIPQICPHDLFQREDGSRGSQLAPDFLALDKLIVVNKQNAATDTAALILPAVGSNYERHPTLQRFMLANDSTTIAVEVPVWLAQDDIAALERQHGIRLLSADAESSITGHIDFLQVRNGAVHILDYKPDARTNKPIARLTIYALALTRLTGLKLFDIKCAWFNENEYCEFFPRTPIARFKISHAAGHRRC